MAGSKSVISGNTSMLVLGLMQNKDMYGYEIIENLQKKSALYFVPCCLSAYILLQSE